MKTKGYFLHIVLLSDKSVGCARNVKYMISICVLGDDVFVGFISKQYIVRLLLHSVLFFHFFFVISAGNISPSPWLVS